MAWSLADAIRFLYYYCAAESKPNYLVKWLRYSAFIPLYPLGFSHEIYAYWDARDKFMVPPKVNSYDLLSYLTDMRILYVLTAVLAIPGILVCFYGVGFLLLYVHMLSQRNKELSEEVKHKKA